MMSQSQEGADVRFKVLQGFIQMDLVEQTFLIQDYNKYIFRFVN